jgi:uncharacterized membrane protein
MRLTTRDWIASVLVGTAVIMAAGWFIGVPGVRSLDIRALTVVVLALGMPVSAAAVVPGFAGLIHGSRAYLLGASALGIAALMSAVLTLVNATEQTLLALVTLMVTLWIVATVRHSGAIGASATRAHN